MSDALKVLEEIEGRVKAATPGPWTPRTHYISADDPGASVCGRFARGAALSADVQGVTCGECLKVCLAGPSEPEQSRRWREENREKARLIQAAYRSRSRAKIREKERRAVSTPDGRRKQLARYRLKFAVRRGWIVRPEGRVFHHPDYERDYYGCWVTPLEHQRIHAGLIECPPCHDYVEQVREQQAAAKSARNSNAGKATCAKRWGRRELSGGVR